MAQEINVITKDRSGSSSKRYPPVFIQKQPRRSNHSPYSDMEELVKVAYKNGIAALDWKEAGLVLTAERDDEGNVVIRQSKYR